MSDEEVERLHALGRYRLLDTPREQDFDEIAEAAAELCETPIAVVNLVGDGRQFFKAEVGLGVRETPLETSFCRQALLHEEFLVVPDASRDPRFEGNPLVTGDPGLRFYAGALLRTAEGQPIGTVCVLDTKPHDLTERQRRGLMRLARQTMAHMELRRALREQAEQRLLHERILDSATDYAIVATDPEGRVTRWNNGAERILGWTEAEMLGRPVDAFFTPEDRTGGRPETGMRLARETGSAPDERWHLRKDGTRFWANGETMPLRSDGGELLGFLKILRDRTGEREAGAALQASELRYRSLVEVSPQVVWFADADGDVTYCNAYWYDYTGLPAGETGEASWMGVIHPDHREATREAWIAAAGRGRPYEVEFPLRRADGEYRWFLSRAHPIRDEDGTLRSWIGTSLDIHDRRQAEEDLRRAREQLRLAVDATGTGIFDYDLVADVLNWDIRTRSFFGLGPNETVNLEVYLARLHPDDRDRCDQAVEAALDPTGSGTYDITYRTIDPESGIERWVSARGQTLFEGDRPMRLIGTARDVTEGRKAEQVLRETEERYRLAARATNDAIWDWDLTTNHVLWNEALQVAHGHPPETVEPTGDWWIDHIHPDDRASISASIHAVIDRIGTTWTDEYRFRRADGSYADILDRGYVIRNDQGRAVRMIGAMFDISERKRAEEHQRLLTGELQHRVKNTLAMVQAIASQTFRNAVDIESAREAFSARLISLGRAHDILTQSSWTQAPIADVVDGALTVHRGEASSRIRSSGPNVALSAKAALALALALHELATNAAKYGALSNEVGTVDLRWHVVHQGDAPRFCLTWSEQGGPPILAQPTRRGFGSRLIERSFAAEVGGEVRLTYAPTGLTCRLEASLASMQEAGDEAAA
ncbi:PAS domain S-box protein [Methylobacterium sp. E-041]|uniref:PAS domain S-box protein n=1 Tax=Methylobacterium sp. E-041 TaxID=2836573 RepID=UPI001FBAB43B|nr:PAS domain S-box protein [Methylobacterium sp. E-041]MCJ2109179.1 PAS domain S-box protein [Methylobacterium sp. E-041]